MGIKITGTLVSHLSNMWKCLTAVFSQTSNATFKSLLVNVMAILHTLAIQKQNHCNASKSHYSDLWKTRWEMVAIGSCLGLIFWLGIVTRKDLTALVSHAINKI